MGPSYGLRVAVKMPMRISRFLLLATFWLCTISRANTLNSNYDPTIYRPIYDNVKWATTTLTDKNTFKAAGTGPITLAPLFQGDYRVLTRFGTPTLSINKTAHSHSAYLHQGIDLAPQHGPNVLAPVSGMATVVSDAVGSRREPYGSALLIRDDETGNFVLLCHVVPVRQASGVTLEEGPWGRVTKGDLIGKTAPVSSAMGPNMEFLRHVHLEIFGADADQLLNPNHLFSNAHSDLLPKIGEIYLINAGGISSQQLGHGYNNLVLEAWQPTKDSNLEIHKVEFTIRDDSGNEVIKVTDCDLNAFANQINPKHNPANILLDLVGMEPQATMLGWSNGLRTDAANPKRTFRYVLSHLAPIPTGGCKLVDGIGILETSDFKFLEVQGKVFGTAQNTTTFSARFLRN